MFTGSCDSSLYAMFSQKRNLQDFFADHSKYFIKKLFSFLGCVMEQVVGYQRLLSRNLQTSRCLYIVLIATLFLIIPNQVFSQDCTEESLSKVETKIVKLIIKAERQQKKLARVNKACSRSKSKLRASNFSTNHSDLKEIKRTKCKKARKRNKRYNRLIGKIAKLADLLESCGSTTPIPTPKPTPDPNDGNTVTPTPTPDPTSSPIPTPTASPTPSPTPSPSPTPTPTPPPPPPGGVFERVSFADFQYLGAVLPLDKDFFYQSSGVITYHEESDTAFMTGRDGNNLFQFILAEPVISATQNINDLNESTNLSSNWGFDSNGDGNPDNFMPIFDQLHPLMGNAKTVGGIAYDNVYNRWLIASWQFYNVQAADNLGLTSLDNQFSDPRGAWRSGPSGVNTPVQNMFHANKTHGNVFRIPDNWVAAYTPGNYMATGRTRSNGVLGSGRGPNLYAVKPNYDAPVGDHFNAIPLMVFTSGTTNIWNNYTSAEQYRKEWIQCKNNPIKQAVIVSSRNGTQSNDYYGDGPAGCNTNKGFHAHPYSPRLELVDVDMLGEVALGSRLPYDVAPYEEMSIDSSMWGSNPNCQSRAPMGLAYDRNNGYLYATQVRVKVPNQNNRMIIHVWKINC